MLYSQCSDDIIEVIIQVHSLSTIASRAIAYSFFCIPEIFSGFMHHIFKWIIPPPPPLSLCIFFSYTR